MRNIYKIAGGYIALTIIAFFVLAVRNIWTPGCAFECYGDDPVDVFGQRLVQTWMYVGVVGSVVLALFAAFYDDMFGDDD